MKKINDLNFSENVIDNNKAVLVEFTADHCAPCQGMARTLDKLAPIYAEHVDFCSADIFACNLHASQYRVQSLPTIIMFVGGVPRGCLTGEQGAKKMRKFIEETI